MGCWGKSRSEKSPGEAVPGIEKEGASVQSHEFWSAASEIFMEALTP
jgi:hypothetical protein